LSADFAAAAKTIMRCQYFILSLRIIFTAFNKSAEIKISAIRIKIIATRLREKALRVMLKI
jgi:hypothetical protein